MEYIQGSTYEIVWSLYVDKCRHKVIDPQGIQSIDFAIGNIIKTYPEEVKYSEENKGFIVKLTADETFSLPAGRITRQARIVFTNGQTKSTKEEFEYVHSSKFKKVAHG